ncbi:MAG: hypothetical protein QM702_25190 [Rubrivivax sp.]
MLIDDRAELASRTPLSTAGTGRKTLGDVMDLSAVPGTLPDDLYLVIQVSQAVLSAGAATVAFELVSDSQAALATDGSATLHLSTGPTPKGSLTAGLRLASPSPCRPGRIRSASSACFRTSGLPRSPQARSAPSSPANPKRSAPTRKEPSNG